MADNIVGNLFGINLDALQKAQDLEAQKNNLAIAQLDPFQARRYYGAELGRGIGKGLETLFGVQDPVIAKQAKVNQILQGVQASMSPEDMKDPEKLAMAVLQAANQAGDQDLANQAYQGLQQARLQNAKVAQEQAQTNKANVETNIKLRELKQQENATAAIKQLWDSKQAEGTTPTNEEIISVAAQYIPAEKLATMMQTSADKAAYRDVMIKQQEMQIEARVEAAKQRNADAIELERIRQDGRKELAALVASLKPKEGNKSSVYERGYANNFVTSTAELVPATANLNVLTQGGTSPVTAGVFTGLKGTGILSATNAALGTAITPTESGQYESIMLPVIANIATMQNAGRRTTIGQIDNLKNALLAKPGQQYIVQIQKMGELRQIVEAAAEAAKTNPAMSEDQLAAIQGNVEKVRQAIPFTGTDVTKFSQYAKKNPGVKFVDWLKVNGSDKEAFQPAVQEKTVNGVTYVNDGKGWKKK